MFVLMATLGAFVFSALFFVYNDKFKQLKKQIGNDIGYEIHELFGNAFANFDIKTDNDYFLSNYYADRIFNQIDGFKVGEEIDGIIYPSVPSSFEENNIVLHKYNRLSLSA